MKRKAMPIEFAGSSKIPEPLLEEFKKTVKATNALVKKVANAEIKLCAITGTGVVGFIAADPFKHSEKHSPISNA